MILARDITTQDGKILCGTGAELTVELLDRLTKAGVAVVKVQGHPVQLPGEQSLRERLSDFELRFSQVKEDPVLIALMKKLIAQHWVDSEREQTRHDYEQ